MSTTVAEQLDVIAVGAHPDDVEIACGGTVAKLVQQGYRVGIIDLTDGEPTPGSAGPEERLAEAKAAAAVLGVQMRLTLDLPNRKLFDSYEARVKLAIEFRRYRPRLVIGLGEKTPLASPDHWQAMQITDAAVFYSRLTKWDDDFMNLPPHAIAAQMYFTLESHRAHPLEGAGQLVVEISDTLEAKLAAVRCYQSQFPAAKQYIFPRIEATAAQMGHAAGFAAGELLVSPRTLGTTNLMKTLFE
jgi:bacillithiol biosynthesis deacetylase BshB1